MTVDLPSKLVSAVAEVLADEERLAAEWEANLPTTPRSFDAVSPEVVSDFAMVLGLRSVGEVAAEVDAAPPRRWLFRRVWPADAYGVLGAKHKAGKSWAMLEAAVAAAGGVPWLGTFDCDTPGPVLFFAGEGGAAKLTRRGRAVAAARGVVWDDLPITVAERVPHLTDAKHLAALAAAVEAYRPVLVIVDPLYLAVGGNGDGRNLYAMGEVLERAQVIAQDHGAALMVSHHNNRNANVSGSDRLSGAGPAEWGRVLVSLDVKSLKADTESGRTEAHLEVLVDGDEVAGGKHRYLRTISAADQDDLASAIRYDLIPTALQGDDDLPGYSPAQRRVLAAVNAADGWVDVASVGDRVADDGAGPPLKRRTIQDALATLTADGLVTARPTQAGGKGAWRRLEAGGTDHE